LFVALKLLLLLLLLLLLQVLCFFFVFQAIGLLQNLLLRQAWRDQFTEISIVENSWELFCCEWLKKTKQMMGGGFLSSFLSFLETSSCW
jgi:hypothetical protein